MRAQVVGHGRNWRTSLTAPASAIRGCHKRCIRGSVNSGSFKKRDSGRNDDETLVSRLVDRCLRPVFEKGWANDTQVRLYQLSDAKLPTLQTEPEQSMGEQSSHYTCMPCSYAVDHS